MTKKLINLAGTDRRTLQPQPVDFVREIAQLGCAVLGKMFDDPGLTSLRMSSAHHPAVDHFERLAEMYRRGSVHVAIPDLLAALSPLQDFIELVPSLLPGPGRPMPSPPEDVWSFLPSDQADRLRSQIRDPERYEDVLLEVSVFNALTTSDLPATIRESPGRTDIAVHTRPPFALEVKHLGRETTVNGVDSAVKNANAQIKRSTEPVGLLVIKLARDVATPIPYAQDGIPADALSRLSRLRSRLTTKMNSSVARIIAIWDELDIRPHATGSSLMVLKTRKVVAISHPSPVQPLPSAADQINLQRTGVMMVGLKAQVAPKGPAG